MKDALKTSICMLVSALATYVVTVMIVWQYDVKGYELVNGDSGMDFILGDLEWLATWLLRPALVVGIAVACIPLVVWAVKAIVRRRQKEE